MREARIDLLKRPVLIPQKTTEEIKAEIGVDAQISNLSASDPAGRIAHGWTVREQKRLAQENENAVNGLLAFAKGSRLDFIGETWYRNSDGSQIKRKANESDDEYRLALQNSPEGLTSAGTLKSYDFHAGRSHVLLNRNTVKSYSPEPMVMNTYFIFDEKVVESANALIENSELHFVYEDALANVIKQAIETNLINFIPGGDSYTAIRATRKTGALLATVKVERGVAFELIKKQGKEALDLYLAKAKRINGVISFSSISESLTVPGVKQIPIPNDWADIECSPSEYPELSSVTLNYIEN